MPGCTTLARPRCWVPLPAIMEVRGWGDAAVAKRYVHVPTEVVTGIADQVGGFVWNAAPQQTAPVGGPSLIDQLQQLLDAAKSSGRDDPPGLHAVV